MRGRQPSRRAFLLSTAAGLLSISRTLAWGGPQVVEDWSTGLLNAKGVPSGWRTYATPGGHAAYDFTLVADGRRRALDLKSAGDHSTIAKEIWVDLDATPILTWQWRVVRLPQGADLTERKTSDATGHLFVVWPRFPALLRSRLIGYVWDRSLPIGSIVRSRKTGTVTFLVVRTGEQGLGQWLEERRNLVEDYRTVFGEAPFTPRAIALSIDTNDTRSPAEALFGRIAFVPSA